MAASLLDQCYGALLEGSYDYSQLEQLPQHILAQVVQRAVKERLEATAQLDVLKAAQENRYQVDPGRRTDRVGDEMYERVEAVTVKWAPVEVNARCFSDLEFSDLELRWNVQSKSFQVFGIHEVSDGNNLYLGDVISSAMLFYRLCCLFPLEAKGPFGYKSVWTVNLLHLGTRQPLKLCDGKGGAHVYFYERPGQCDFFENDVVELLNLLCDPNCPHPYDGTVAGTMA